MNALLKILEDKHFLFTPEFDGVYHRFDRFGKNLSGWFKGCVHTVNNKQVYELNYGDWATGEHYSWCDTQTLTDEDKAQLEALRLSTKKEANQMKQRGWLEVATRAETYFNSIQKLNTLHPYCKKKGLTSNYGAKITPTKALIVPRYDVKGKMWGLQFIQPDGKKLFQKGSRIAGCFYTIGKIEEKGVIYVCEGFATGASIYQSLTRMEPVHRTQPNGVGKIQNLGESSGFTTSEGASANPPSGNGPVGQSMAKDAQKGAGAPSISKDEEIGHGDDRRPDTYTVPKPLSCEIRSDLRQNSDENTAGDICKRGPESTGCNPLERQEEIDHSRKVGLQPSGLPGDADQSNRGASVCCAFTASNLIKVAKELKKAYPLATLVVAADEDLWTISSDGKPTNPGRKASKICKRDYGAILAFPRFSDISLRDKLRLTDFNDLMVYEGESAVKRCLQARCDDGTPTKESVKPPTPQPQDPPAPRATYLNPPIKLLDEPATLGSRCDDFPPILPPEASEDMTAVRRSGALILPTDSEIVDHLAPHLRTNLIYDRKTEVVFKFVGTHWRRLNYFEEDLIKQAIIDICAGKVDRAKIQSTYKLLIEHGLPKIPNDKNIYEPPFGCANFLNGTLKLSKNFDSLKLYPHDKHDYIINLINLNCPEDLAGVHKLASNDVFDAMLDRVAARDADKIRTLSQMFGACLMPIAPKIFMLYGPPATGKSTIIKLAAKLVSEDNTCSVDPSDFDGQFNRESMVGKLLNFDTDIKTTTRISESIIKKIEDRVKFRISGKFVKDIYAPLPSVHIFGGNGIPNTQESGGQALDRRWILLEFNNVMDTEDKENLRDFDELCFRHSPEGVLKFALLGLYDLVSSNRKYFIPNESRLAMREWDTSNDPIAQFLDDIKSGEVVYKDSTVIEDENAFLERAKMWDIFVEWSENAFGKFALSALRISKFSFYKRLYAKKFKILTVNGYRGFKGFGLKPKCETNF